jgi:hypothetical protein
MIQVIRKKTVKLVNRSCSGGRVKKDADRQEVFVIPARKPMPGKLQDCWQTGPVANSKFSEKEMTQIKPSSN